MNSTYKFTIRTLGCKVNQYESQVLRENLVKVGFVESPSAPADIVVVNSCTVTGKADAKTRRLIKRLKKENPNATVVVTGCKAVFDGDIKSLLEMTEVDEIVVNSEKMNLPLFIGAHYGLECKRSDLKEEITNFSSHTRAFIKIQDGCDQNCSYCKVSLVRGPSKSRSAEEIIKEAKRLIEHGYKEIVLTGICIGSWKGEGGKTLADLLKEINAIEGDYRFRISSIEPNHITDELIETVAASGKICHHLHIPLQSGSDRILRSMARRYDADQFRKLVYRIRERMPFAGITMDVIAGFPGEEEEDFEDTFKLVKELEPSRLHVFKYSDREGTLSSKMKNKLPDKISAERVEKLIKLGEELQDRFCRKFLSKEVEVLLENKAGNDFIEGYTREYVRVRSMDFMLPKGQIIYFTPKSADKEATLVIKNKELTSV